VRFLTAAAAWLALASPARADEYNYRNLLVGLRSSSMGGADTAFADSVTGAYYNPAGLASTPTRLVSISLSAYRLDLSGFADIEAREGQSGRAAGLQLNSFPLSFGLTTRLGDGAGLTDHTLGFNFFVEDNTVGGSRIDVRLPGVADLYLRVRRNDQQTIQFGTAWGARRGPVELGLGAAYRLRSESLLVDSLVDIQGSVSYRLQDTQAYHGSLVGRAGAIFHLDNWRAGAALTTPGLRLHSSAAVSRVELRTGTDAQLVPTDTEPMAYRTPWLLALGGGWESAGTRVAVDLLLYSGVPRYAVMRGIAEAEGEPLVNFSAGVELPVSDAISMRLGVFSNLAASPEPSGAESAELDDPTRLPHVSFWGATIGASKVSGETSLDVSLIYQFATGSVPGETNRGYDRVSGHVIVFMLGGSYNFDAQPEAA
jgi:hypothetical protein